MKEPILKDRISRNGSIQISVKTIAGEPSSNTPFRVMLRKRIAEKLAEEQNKLEQQEED